MIDKFGVFRNAARYMGYPKKSMTAEVEALLEKAYADLLLTATPRHVLKRVNVSITQEGLVFGGLPPLQSRDLCKLFSGASEGYALLATLGAELDMKIKRLMVNEPALATALGACGSAYIDEYIDDFLQAENEQLATCGLTLSPRFSPGYGDVPLTYQKPLLQLLQAMKIGVTLTDTLFMLPEKSVSAVIAVRQLPCLEE